jgi:DNA-binding response OmpR family regulator
VLLRRWHGVSGERTIIRIRDLEIDPGARTVHRGGEEVALSPKAFDLLLALVRREGAVASRNDLMREVWGHRAAILSRTVDAHVKELRRKLEGAPGSPELIATVWKAGYRIKP